MVGACFKDRFISLGSEFAPPSGNVLVPYDSSLADRMPVTVEGLNPRAKTLYYQVKEFITEKIAPVENDYVRHTKSENRWKVFEPVEKLKV